VYQLRTITYWHKWPGSVANTQEFESSPANHSRLLISSKRL